jgi:transcriptional regulator with XRE-family HTH domain
VWSLGDDNERAVAHNIYDDEMHRQFARNLRAARQRAGLTQADMAARLGMIDEAYARYERVKTWPGLDRLCHLCRILDCSADFLLGRDESPQRPPRPPLPDDDPPAVRQLLHRLRKARPRTVRLVTALLRELEETHGGKRGNNGKLGEGGDP